MQWYTWLLSLSDWICQAWACQSLFIYHFLLTVSALWIWRSVALGSYQFVGIIPSGRYLATEYRRHESVKLLEYYCSELPFEYICELHKWKYLSNTATVPARVAPLYYFKRVWVNDASYRPIGAHSQRPLATVDVFELLRVICRKSPIVIFQHLHCPY